MPVRNKKLKKLFDSNFFNLSINKIETLVSKKIKNTDKDAPLREDIRFLGRLLGNTVREQNGEPTYQINTCHALSSNGPIVKTRWPTYYTEK